jgi:hypothetical protein
MSVSHISVGQMSVSQISVGQMSFGQMVFDQKSVNQKEREELFESDECHLLFDVELGDGVTELVEGNGAILV